MTKHWISDMSARELRLRHRKLVSVSLLAGLAAGGLMLVAVDRVVPIASVAASRPAPVEHVDPRRMEAAHRELGAMIEQLDADGREYGGHRAAAVALLHGAERDVAAAIAVTRP